MIELGVNIDHIATVRQARRTVEPDPVWAAVLAELGGADGITVHLREDRRHINDRDVALLKQTVRCKLNLELSCAAEIVDVACRTVPDQATLVPEKREEITTEGGLDVVADSQRVREIVARLKDCGVFVSLFLGTDPQQLEAGFRTGCDAVELHTGAYADAKTPSERDAELQRLIEAGRMIVSADCRLHAGHGLNYHNVRPIAAIPRMRELNIGHSIVARALMTGLKDAVAEMKRLLDNC